MPMASPGAVVAHVFAGPAARHRSCSDIRIDLSAETVATLSYEQSAFTMPEAFAVRDGPPNA